MEISPGQGTEHVRLGQKRDEVEARLGPPDRIRDRRVFHESLRPVHILDYDDSDRVELIEVPYADEPEHEVILDGVQLTHRLLHEVRDELVAAGHQERASDIGFDFADGFAIWSMGSVELPELPDGVSPDDDDALVVEGVSVGRPGYFGF